MAKVTKLAAQLAGPNRRPGQYYIRTTKWGLVLQKWPRKREGKKTPAQVYNEGVFADAARNASNPDPQQLQQAIAYAQGTFMVPRDFLTGAAYGTLQEYFFEDGTPWPRYRDMVVNAQLVLDQVYDQAPAVLWRAEVGWIGSAPTAVGQYLYYDETGVRWASATPPAAPQPTLIPPGMQFNGVGTNVAANTLTGSYTPLKSGVLLTGLAVLANAAAATAKLTPALYRSPPTGTVPLVASGPQVTGVTAGLNFLPFTTPYLTTDNSLYLPGVQTLNALWSQVNTNTTVPGWQASTANPIPSTFVFGSGSYGNQFAHVFCY